MHCVYNCNVQSVIFLILVCVSALEDAVEVLSSGQEEKPQLQLILLQDYDQLERYDDYEEDEGELRAESSLIEKFG